MKTINSKIKYKKDASRWELLVRLIYAIPIAVVIWIFSLVMGVVLFVQWFHILLLGERHKSLHNLISTYLIYVFRVRTYLNLGTDERPPIVPEEF